MGKGPQTARLIGSILNQPTEAGSCEKHGPYNSVRVNGELRCPRCMIEQDTLRAQEEAKATRRRGEIQGLVHRSGIPLRFQSKTFDNFEAADDKQSRVLRICKAYADKFNERYAAGGGLVMCGQPGTGKTHLACAIANQIMGAGRTAVFMTALHAVRRVKETYGQGSNETEREAIGKFFEPDLLILDEIGVQIGSVTEHNILFEIINGRYERVLPTILLSNLTEAEMESALGARVIDRMREGGGLVMAFDWQSKRKDIKTASRDMPAWAQL